jgi:pimeloyl-ACP methyl ester carboxylesterase
MPTAIIDGIKTHYEVLGSGPPLLMYAPGGFNATIASWSSQGIYAKIRLLDYLPRTYTCVVFDRRECGQSGGRVERVAWSSYVAQGKGLLDHLGFDQAHLFGGCMGCCSVTAFAVAYPATTLSMILWWPVGGAKYRIRSQQRFAEHLAFVRKNGLHAVVDLVARSGKSFGDQPQGGPWASVLKHDPAFTNAYVNQDPNHYELVVTGMGRTLFDRDTSPGAEPEDLLTLAIPALIIPGDDASHATSAAQYLHECLSNSQYWNAPVAEQTQPAAATQIQTFLQRLSLPREA